MTDTNATTSSDTPEWVAIPPAPKVPNFHQGYGYTLHYGSPGWDVHEGTHDTKDALGDVLFHARKAAEAKQWVVDNHKPTADAKVEVEPSDKPAKARKPRKSPGPRSAAAKAVRAGQDKTDEVQAAEEQALAAKAEFSDPDYDQFREQGEDVDPTAVEPTEEELTEP